MKDILVVFTTNGAGESASYTYDKNGKATSVTVSREENGQTLTYTSHYSYNAAGDITEGADLCNALFFKGIAYANRFAERIFIRFAP